MMLNRAEIRFSDYPEPGSIEIPYRDANDNLTGFRRWRLPRERTNGQKYHQEIGSGVHAYLAPGGVKALPAKNEFGLAPNSLVLVEGEFKSLSLVDAGVPAIGLPSFNVYTRNDQGKPAFARSPHRTGKMGYQGHLFPR
jgi:hypothetical protein